MRKDRLTLAILFTALSIAACTYSPFQKSERTSTMSPVTHQESANRSPIGGSIEKSMDSTDKEKVSHALDKPLGKSTDWTNAATGTSYTVTPIKKLAIDGNPYCRQYKIEATVNDDHQEVTGTACVSASDSSWRLVSFN
jgi:surface antigen